MKTVRLLVTLLSSGCAYDMGPDTLRKGEVDEPEMLGGIEVALDGTIATVNVPFSTPAPDVPEDDFEDEMEGAVSLRVVGSQSGAAAALMAGESVDDEPAASGEFTWSLTEGRDAAVFRFFNEAPGGMTLQRGNAYTAQFSITSNDYVKSVAAMAFEVSVVGE